MKLDDLRSIDQLRDFLEGTQAVAFTVVTNKDERYQWMQRTLIRFGYRQLSKADKGIVIRYLIKISGYSRQQVSRLIGAVCSLWTVAATTTHGSRISAPLYR